VSAGVPKPRPGIPVLRETEISIPISAGIPALLIFSINARRSQAPSSASLTGNASPKKIQFIEDVVKGPHIFTRIGYIGEAKDI
jgi:hypothetical protein